MMTLAEELQENKKKSHKQLVYIGSVSIVMFFMGLTSAYIVRMERADWLNVPIPDAFFTSTILIIISSLTMILGHYGARKGSALLRNGGLFATLALGIGFVFLQYTGYTQLIDQGIHAMGAGANASASYLYVLSLMHVLHLVAGLIVLIVTVTNSLRGKYTTENYLGIELCSIYWHFLDVLWVYLLLFLNYIN